MTVCFRSSHLSQIIAILILFAQYMQISAEIKAEINFDVKGKGFHRTLIYQVSFKNLTNDNCRVAIYLELPPALYVNIDEIADLRRRQTMTICSIGETDDELFAEDADRQNVTMCKSMSSLSSCILMIPVHQRYQHARENGNYVNMILPKPRLFLGCHQRIKGHRVSKIDLCKPCVDLVAKWREVPYNIWNNHDYVWPIAVGDTSLSVVVTCLTLSLTIICAIFIGIAIRTNAMISIERRYQKKSR